MTDIREARDEEMGGVRGLMEEYASWLGLDLSFQDFARECRELPGEYAPPAGALLVALVGGELGGMVALRPRGEGRCEMKRLYVRPNARGLGLGRALANQVLAEARQRGYHEIVLDTLPVMQDAQQLYGRLGFRDIEPYYSSPVAGTRFMALTLTVPIAGR